MPLRRRFQWWADLLEGGQIFLKVFIEGRGGDGSIGAAVMPIVLAQIRPRGAPWHFGGEWVVPCVVELSNHCHW